MDTIFALASARGKAGVAVIRISGPESHRVFDIFGVPRPAARVGALRTLTGPKGVIDQALVLRFDAPQSFTGEDSVELQTHGSTAIVDAILNELAGHEGFRAAEAGEFTRRALENERLDIAQIEGLADLIEAETEAQRRQAIAVFSGALGALVESWRKRLIRAAALLEATIDFVDEDVPVDVLPEVRDLLGGVSQELSRESDGVGIAERIRDGFEIAIVGPPNAGKSTLLNALAGREAAITSEIAGTTRDVIEVRMDIGGLAVTFLDTAGLRSSDDVVEALGIERARERAERADLRVILKVSRDKSPVLDPRGSDIVLVSRSDIQSDADISGVTGDGLDHLVAQISVELSQRASGAGVAMRARHKAALDHAIKALGIAMDRVETAPDLAELIAEDLRAALRSLDVLVGRVDVEHVLDDVFSSFCIGK